MLAVGWPDKKGPDSFTQCLIERMLGESDFVTMSKAMKDHYAPAPSEIVQRFRFNSRFCRTGESVSTYVHSGTKGTCRIL